MKNLLREFNEMKNLPTIEVNRADFLELKDDDYVVYNLYADEKGLYSYGGIFIEWDECFSLYEHLQYVYELIINQIISE